MSDGQLEASTLLFRMSEGDDGAEPELYGLVYDDLHRRAWNLMANRQPGETLQPTALVNEAWLRLSGGEQRWNGREHFLRVATKAMRNALVDHARARGAAKRTGPGERIELELLDATELEPDGTLLAVHEAVESLGEVDSDAARVAELRLFGGLGPKETGAILGVSSRTVDRHWRFARAWLQRELSALQDET